MPWVETVLGMSCPEYESSWVWIVMGTSWPGHKVTQVRVVLGTSCPGYELSWARVVLGRSWLGYELSWIRVVLVRSSPDPENYRPVYFSFDQYQTTSDILTSTALDYWLIHCVYPLLNGVFNKHRFLKLEISIKWGPALEERFLCITGIMSIQIGFVAGDQPRSVALPGQ